MYFCLGNSSEGSRRLSVTAKLNVAIIGAGVVGLGIAWRLAARGASVTVFDRGAIGAGASHAAAGMLAACAQAKPFEEALISLVRDSHSLSPPFPSDLHHS